MERTIGFLDMSGFTAFANHHGDQAAVDQLSVFRSIVRATTAAKAVRVVKWLGDGAMFADGDVPAVLSCLLTIMGRAEAKTLLQLRGGVATGRVILFEGDDYIGASINLAARLADAAGPGELLAPATIIHGLRASPTIREIELAGFDDALEVVDLTRSADLVEALNL